MQRRGIARRLALAGVTARRSTRAVARPAPRVARPVLGGAVVAGGLAFLLLRPALAGPPLAVPVLTAGYLALTAGALAVPDGTGVQATRAGWPGGRRVAPAPAGPLGWALPLALGVAAVAAAAVVAGPVPDRRAGAAATGLALLAAVAEEALFRRLLYGRLLAWGPVVAVAGSAAIFALVHLPAYGVAALAVDLGAGLLLSWQRYASGRWTVPAVTHAVANLLAVS